MTMINSVQAGTVSYTAVPGVHPALQELAEKYQQPTTTMTVNNTSLNSFSRIAVRCFAEDYLKTYPEARKNDAGQYWLCIYYYNLSLNRNFHVPNPNLIYAGQELYIPPKGYINDFIETVKKNSIDFNRFAYAPSRLAPLKAEAPEPTVTSENIQAVTEEKPQNTPDMATPVYPPIAITQVDPLEIAPQVEATPAPSTQSEQSATSSANGWFESLKTNVRSVGSEISQTLGPAANSVSHTISNAWTEGKKKLSESISGITPYIDYFLKGKVPKQTN
ncbi:MAG: hypothetical protein DKM50_00810 [Candidatus Margulisiibacteriota bacterium]|nr:MAG: hypothetical protein A2X43_05285 [Candidatus Margulisbacteria bacterium GWD2_39_127]OGI01475.1 MAG: hypothetical protein A2X42_11890 [Candidatus Margulisbacteria bacterium GWF2_38_17]OGI10818.1 MAG: hypothetical protein A2X41_10115 [Candidatus Margulisbacteria bacterium GWE2_39_32]PZM83956.1 MAG: hypothetical protein DKM50_00810 [Candidatus Margulisiibacteriota bacterium]HAR64454.1 hypothetical protein [Candidatus Margulisiibacteriota bacterium]